MVSERSVSSPPCSPPAWLAEWRPPLWLWSCLLPSLCWASSHGSPLTHILQRQTSPCGQCPDWSSPQCPLPPHYPQEALPAPPHLLWAPATPKQLLFPEQTWLTQALRPLPSLYSYMAFPPTWSTLTYPSKFKAGVHSSRKPSLTSQLLEENNPCPPIASWASTAHHLLITLKWWIYVFVLLSVYWTHGKQRFLLTIRIWANRGIPHFTAFYFMVFHRYYGVSWVFICLKKKKQKKVKGCGNPLLSKSVDPIFPRTSAHFESLSHFGNSHNISKFFIVIYVMIIWSVDVWFCFHKKIDYDSLKDQRMVSIF